MPPIPYRAKNPPEAFPYMTLLLIAMNILAYALTTEHFLHIRESIVRDFAISYINFTPSRLVASMFLHQDLMHLLSNMLFLWVFGPAVEGRLKAFKFLIFYLFIGIIGSLLYLGIEGVLHPKMPGIGASGAIMGLAGAYLYLFPYAQIMMFVGHLYWIARLNDEGEYRLITPWLAKWVVLLFISVDIFSAWIWRSVGLSDGVAHLVHIGGFAAGFLIPLVLRMPHDSEEASKAQATRVDIRGDFLALNTYELEALINRGDASPAMLEAYVFKLQAKGDESSYKQAFDALLRYRNLVNKMDGQRLAAILLRIPPRVGRMPEEFEMELANNLERNGDYDLSAKFYRRCATDPNGPNTEMALARLARLVEQMGDRKEASAIWIELLRLFPHTVQLAYAEAAIQRLGPPDQEFRVGPLDSPQSRPRPAGLDTVQADTSAPPPSVTHKPQVPTINIPPPLPNPVQTTEPEPEPPTISHGLRRLGE
jgi:membrane associated rhomboid family serine protease